MFLTQIFLKFLPYLLMGVLIFNLIQRPFMKFGEKKRLATLYISLMILAVYGSALIIYKYIGNDLAYIPVIAILLYISFRQKDAVLPFKRKCIRCSSTLPLKKIFFNDSNLCADCDAGDRPDSPEPLE